MEKCFLLDNGKRSLLSIFSLENAKGQQGQLSCNWYHDYRQDIAWIPFYYQHDTTKILKKIEDFI